ncbi:MAG: hypothetical protein K6E73_06210 [Bacteroidales bacterium]|nr:hypothetical protein [Bacteroidales bacterium]
MKHLLSLILLLSAAIFCKAESQPLAFPTADGYARHITGGRGGKVYYVTSLDDCTDDNLVPGTLRWALRTGDDTPRTILFAVNGTIYLNSKLKTNHANVSILGQSAPGGGVCITGYPMVINSRNYIVRYVRFRAGDIPAQQSSGNESFSGLDIENAAEVILDHCSVTWSMEECLTMFDNDTTTVQYCIIGEGLYHSYNVKTTGDDSGRAFAMQWGGDHSNMHHTLITNCNGRAPRFNGVREANAWLEGKDGKQYAHDCHIDGDFANNVLYNWGGGHLSYYGGEFYASYFADAPAGLAPYNRVYMRNNYFRPGPSTKVNGGSYRHFFHPSGDTESQVGQWYLAGNKFELSSYYAPSGTYWTDAALQTVNDDNLAGFGTSATALDMSANYASHIMSAIPYELSGYEPTSADEAYTAVTDAARGAGANLPRYDEVDQRLVDEAGGRRDGVTPFKGSRATGASKRPGIIDTPSDIVLANGTDQVTVGGVTYSCYPTLALRDGERYAVDSDGDGMPDAYETTIGLDPNDAADGAASATNGYTNLEIYLNGLADFSLNNADYQTSDSYVTPGLATRPQSVTISFANKDDDVTGAMPSALTIGYGDAVTFTKPFSIYKEDYTMTGWTDGNMTYLFDTEYSGMFVEDVTLTPSFTKNGTSIAERSDDVTIAWDFTIGQAPALANGKSGIFVAEARIDDATIDVPLHYDGLTITLPAEAGSVATVTYSSNLTQEFAAIGSSLDITLQNAQVARIELLIPYVFDPTGIEFHTPAVGTVCVGTATYTTVENGVERTWDYQTNLTHSAMFNAASATDHQLVYGNLATVKTLAWMETIGQERDAYRNCIDPVKDNGTYSDDGATTAALYGFIVGQSSSSTYKLVAYVKDCARVRTYVSGSNSAGDQVQLKAIPADGSDAIVGNNNHTLSKSAHLSESFDMELDPTQSYKLVWSSVGGNDMMVGAIKLFDATAASANSGTASALWTWSSLESDGSIPTAATTDPAKAFAATTATAASGWVLRDVFNEGVAHRPDAAIGSTRDANYAIRFSVKPAAGFQFKPTRVSFYASMSGSCKLDVDVQQGNSTAIQLKQAESLTPTLTKFTYDVADASYANDSCHLIFYPYASATASATARRFTMHTIVIEGEYESHVVKHSITTAVTPADAGVVTQSPKGKSFAEGAEVTFSATAVNGYLFQHWTNSAGEVLSADAKFIYTVGASDDVITANFKDLSESDIFRDGPFQAIVSTADELAEALAAAQQSTDARYRIFMRNGDYDFGSSAMTAVPQRTSLIGESSDGVCIFNCPSADVTKYQDETPVLYIAPDQNDVYMQDITVRQARDWADKTSRGQALAIRQRGKRAIYRNVTIQGVQDSYYLNKADATAYFEGCTVAGEVDFIYGDGTAYFNRCTLQPVSSSAYITAPNTQAGQIGFVFDSCTIARPADAKDAVTGYRLGRPWGDSPSATFINTTMQVLPADAGWGSMTTGLVVRFHEFGSVAADGSQLDLSSRSIAACNAADGSDAPVLTAAKTADYAIDKVFTDWSPADSAAQLTAPALTVADGILTWPAVSDALCYAIVCDGRVIDFTTATSYGCPTLGQYAIRVANRMGGLGTASNTVTSDAVGLGSIHELVSDAPAAIYNIVGQRVNGTANGFVITRGNKAVVK